MLVVVPPGELGMAQPMRIGEDNRHAPARLQLVQTAVDPPGEAKTDLEIFGLVAESLGGELPYDGPEDVMREILRQGANLRAVFKEHGIL